MRRLKVGTVMIIELISLVVAALLLAWITGNIGVLVYLFEPNTLLILLILALPALFANGLAGDFARLFKRNKDNKESLGDLKKSLLAVELLQKQFIYAGLMTVPLDIVIILRDLTKPESLGPYIAVLVITVFYIGVLELLLMPLKVAVEKRITEYMEEDA